MAAVVAAMGRVVFNDFSSWDDPHTIWMNPAFNPPTVAKVLAFWDVRNPEAGLWVPLTYTVWGALAKLAWLGQAGAHGERLNPMMFHAASLIAHVLSTLIVFALLRRLMPRDEGRAVAATPCAWVGAAVFGVHPLQVEAVGWTSGLKDLLWVLCAVAAVYGYVRSAEARRFWRSPWWWAGWALFALGSLCKPTAMVTPALAGVVHWLGMRRPLGEVVRGVGPWFVLVPLIGWLARENQLGQGIPTLGLPMRPLIALDALAFYLWKLAWPAGLALDYGRTPAVALAKGYLWWTWIAPVAVAAVLAWKRTAWPLAVAGGAWAVIAVSPVSGVVPFLFQYYTTVSDHYVYGSMVGVGMAAAALVGGLGAPVRPKVVATSVGVVLAVWIGISVRQMGTWRDDRTLYGHALSVNPRSFASWTNLGGDAMLLETRRRRAEPANVERALAYVDSALAVNPRWTKAHDVKTIGLILLERTDEAIASARNVLETAPSIPAQVRGPMMVGRETLGGLLLRQGRRDEAIRQFELALEELEAAPSEHRDQDRRRLEAWLERARRAPAAPAPR